MYAVRRFAVRHARFFEGFYQRFERLMVALDPVFAGIGYNRVERPVAFLERTTKGLLFDCKMCGQCVLSSTGMSCPMNCPKNLRNGPCGGVRPGGFCEVKPQMRCVWVEGWEGARRMRQGLERIAVVQPPVDRTLEGSSSWLRVAREKAAMKRASGAAVDPGKSTIASAFKRARIFEPASAPLAKEPAKALADQAVGERTSVLKPRKPDGGAS
ncbi:MAG: methylenetetrahydrofolate reductase C-terminal domain-containing protein [Hyphomicrobiaceae bacterium]